VQGVTGPTGATGNTGERGLVWRGTWSPLTAYAIGDAVAYLGSSYVAPSTQGVSGSQNVPGTVGVNWALLAQKGDQGIQGVQGVRGLQGVTGPTGAQGTSINFIGTVATQSELPTTGNQVNDAYIALDTTNVFVWGGSSWSNVGPIQGPRGFTGATGPTGPTGPRGFFTVVGTYSTLENLTAAYPTAVEGQAAFVNGVYYYWNIQTASWTATADLTGPTGPVGINWRGAWSSATTYAQRDAVSYLGASYYANANSNINGVSFAPGTGGSNWQLIAAKGEQGITGPTGASGVFSTAALPLVANGSQITMPTGFVFYDDGGVYRKVTVKSGTIGPTSPQIGDVWISF